MQYRSGSAAGPRGSSAGHRSAASSAWLAAAGAHSGNAMVIATSTAASAPVSAQREFIWRPVAFPSRAPVAKSPAAFERRFTTNS